jgi:Ca-activated chloride channel family protein
MRGAFLFFVLLLVLLLTTAEVRAMEVRILQPPPGQPLLGEVEVWVEVLPAGTPVERVEILLDGKAAGTAEQAPYRLRIDAGEEGLEHRLEAVAQGTDGSRTSALLVTPALQADARIQVDLQQLFITVERGGRQALDLGRDDFTVLDQGVPQPVVTFGRGDVPFTAVLLVDSSDSMYGGDLEKALEGAKAFFAAMAPLDQAKLMLFSDHVRLETPFTSVQPLLTLGLRGVTAAGGTALNDALYLAVKRLETRRGRKIAVLLSDGVDVESVLSIAETRAIARRQVTLYWLRLPGEGKGKKVMVQSAWRDPAEHEREIGQLRAAVLESGGRVLDLDSVGQIPATLTTLLRELRDQYVLGIAPHTGSRGAWHEIKVQVREGEARTQDGYFEP